MNDTDRKTGFDLRRRQILVLLGTALLTGRAPAQSEFARAPDGNLPVCRVTPAQTEGPYFVDEHLNRSDLRVDPADGSVKAGVPLRLELRVFSMSRVGCLPLAGAVVDIWHCDAVGLYSDVTGPSFTTVGKRFLRGYQVTDANGSARFTTIYPGGYRGRTVHLHFKVRAKAPSGQHYEFTSQLYFDDAITDRVHAHPPYASRGQRTLKNDEDGLFREGGNQLLLALVESGPGYAATFDVGLPMA